MLTLDKVDLWQAGQQVLCGVTLALGRGQVGCIVGKSGSGKTSLLRVVAGLEELRGGTVKLDGRTLSAVGNILPPEQRGVGMVFQDGALFPHLTVTGNICFALAGSGGADQRCGMLVDLLHLQDLTHKFPHELSGGEQQRVALARALAVPPKMLLLDEPFSSLDYYMRGRLAQDLCQLFKDENITALMVSHDQLEAFAISDYLGVLHEGRLLQWDSPHAVYHQPNGEYVARFVGEGGFISGEVQDDRSVETALGTFVGEPHGFDKDSKVRVLLRPDDILHDDGSKMQAKVISKIYRGAVFLYRLQLDSGEMVYSLVPSHHDHEVGLPIGIRMEVDHLVVFAEACHKPHAAIP